MRGARSLDRAPLLLREPSLNITTVIFDLDGTLVDSLPLTFRAFRQATRPFLGRDLSDEEILERAKS